MKAKCKLLMLLSWLIAPIHCLARALSCLFTAVNCFAHKQLELEECFCKKMQQNTSASILCPVFIYFLNARQNFVLFLNHGVHFLLGSLG